MLLAAVKVQTVNFLLDMLETIVYITLLEHKRDWLSVDVMSRISTV